MRVLVALSVTAALVGAHAAYAEPVTLLCRASFEGRPTYVRVVRVDFGVRTVDGIPAQFDQDTIKWRATDKHGTWVSTLNRLAGTLQTWPDTGISASPPPLFSCEKAPPPKF